MVIDISNEPITGKARQLVVNGVSVNLNYQVNLLLDEDDTFKGEVNDLRLGPVFNPYIDPEAPDYQERLAKNAEFETKIAEAFAEIYL